jgi:hypothetical protein
LDIHQGPHQGRSIGWPRCYHYRADKRGHGTPGVASKGRQKLMVKILELYHVDPRWPAEAPPKLCHREAIADDVKLAGLFNLRRIYYHDGSWLEVRLEPLPDDLEQCRPMLYLGRVIDAALATKKQTVHMKEIYAIH